MTYEINWYTEDQVLCLGLPENPSMDEFDAINQEITQILKESRVSLSLIINTNKLKTGYHTATYLRDTQKYMNHRKLDTVYVIADNKLNRLIMTLAFSLCRANFFQFESYSDVQSALQQRGYYPKIGA